jgi:hypothetical protein
LRSTFVVVATRRVGNRAGVSFGGILALPGLTFFAGEAVQRRQGMFPTIAESAALVSIILLLMLFLPSRYRRPIVVVALLVVLLMLLAVPFLAQFF